MIDLMLCRLLLVLDFLRISHSNAMTSSTKEAVAAWERSERRYWYVNRSENWWQTCVFRLFDVHAVKTLVLGSLGE